MNICKPEMRDPKYDIDREEWLKEENTYHAPDHEQQKKYKAIEEATIKMMQAIFLNVPHCADRTAALRKLRECRMTANAAIALKGLI